MAEKGDLRRIREVNWDEVEAEETRLLRALTPAEGMREFFLIQAASEHQYRLTDELFQREREAQLIRMQTRLALVEERRKVPVDALIESVVQMQQHLETAGIPSVLIGGLAVSAWGEPRGTRDVDLKIMLKREDAQRLLDVLGQAYTPFHADPLRNLRGNGLLFVRDPAGTRIDLHLADTSFDESAIARGQLVELQPGWTVRVCSPEDLIVYKWLAPRGRDYDDIVSVIRRQQDQLDDAYVVKWLKEFEEALDDSTLVRDYQQMRKTQSFKLK
jgi:hypothetical protein